MPALRWPSGPVRLPQLELVPCALSQFLQVGGLSPEGLSKVFTQPRVSRLGCFKRMCRSAAVTIANLEVERKSVIAKGTGPRPQIDGNVRRGSRMQACVSQISHRAGIDIRMPRRKVARTETTNLTPRTGDVDRADRSRLETGEWRTGEWRTQPFQPQDDQALQELLAQ